MTQPGELLPMTIYRPNRVIDQAEYCVQPEDITFMDLALEKARSAGEAGDNAIGCTLVLPNGHVIGTETREFRDDNLESHAEKLAYKFAQPFVGRDLHETSLYTIAEPCFGCAYTYDKGNLGMLFVAAKKTDAPEFFRNTETLHHIWSKTRRTLRVVSGLQSVHAVELLTSYQKKH